MKMKTKRHAPAEIFRDMGTLRMDLCRNR
jgi:hypothetical protein